MGMMAKANQPDRVLGKQSPASGPIAGSISRKQLASAEAALGLNEARAGGLAMR